MKKSDRIEAWLDTLHPPSARSGELHRCYLGYFDCFNRQLYYEAHDVLEHLWLPERGGCNDAFYKGLIQLAGAFVHLKKQYERPEHPKDGRRLRPASRLFRLAEENLARYPARYCSLDLERLRRFCESHSQAIERSGFRVNPWCPERAPRLTLEGE